MLISSPEFTLIELDLVSGSGGGKSFSIPSSNERSRSSHPFQNRLQQVRQGVQLIAQSLPGRSGIAF